MTGFTFADYCKAAKLPVIPEFADNITMRYKPFKHQIGDLNFLASFTRSGLWSEPGVGKTLPAQAYGLWLVAQGNKVIYVMPPVLVAQFSNSLETSYPGYSAWVSCSELQGTPAKRDKLMAPWRAGAWPDILIMSYRMFVLYHVELKAAGYTCVVVDEATAVKTPSSQTHHAVKVFAGNAKKDSNGVVLMTGSPVDTNVLDAYGLIAIITPHMYGCMRTFEGIHCIKTQMFIGLDEDGNPKTRNTIVGYKNFDQLNRALFAQGRRIKKADVSDLPPRLITEIPVKLSKTHRELYNRIVDERIAEIGDRVLDMTEASALYQGLQRILVSPERFTDKEIPNEVLDTLDTLLESLEGNKVVVYAWFQESIEKLKARYASHNPAVLYGKTVGHKRQMEKMRFIEDPTCRVIFANPRSGGVGIDGFQEVSSHVVFAEVCPFVGVFQQACDRLHRTGQKAKAVNVYVLVPTGTIAVKLRNDLVRKDMQQEFAVQDKRAVLTALMGKTGIQGSLDALSYSITAQDDLALLDNYQE